MAVFGVVGLAGNAVSLRALVDLILATTRNLPAAMVALGLAGESCSSA